MAVGEGTARASGNGRSAATGGRRRERPEPQDRRFASKLVDEFVAGICQLAAADIGPHAARVFANCYPNTLDSTVFVDGAAGETFVITGDIPAMWLRDSAAQVWPYLHLVKRDRHLDEMIRGLIKRQARSVLLDPYANAFLADADSRETHFADDRTDMRPGVYERKWEIDSLAYFLRLSAGYAAVGGDLAVFDATWRAAVRATLDTFDVQRGPQAYDFYQFQRHTPQGSDTHPLNGRGNPGRPCGLIRSAFRCSDDATVFPYLIPSNLMAAAELRRAAKLLTALGEAELAERAAVMAGEVRAAVWTHGTVEHPRHGRMLAYEVDGYGSALLMDDAGIPGLVSLAYLGAIARDDPLYRNTRAFALSEDNPYYFAGSSAAGLGSPHTSYGSVWPMGVIAAGLTEGGTEGEVARRVSSLDAGTGFCHESLDPDDPSNFTRPWFAWVNGLYGELVCRAVGRPLFETPYEDF